MEERDREQAPPLPLRDGGLVELEETEQELAVPGRLGRERDDRRQADDHVRERESQVAPSP